MKARLVRRGALALATAALIGGVGAMSPEVEHLSPEGAIEPTATWGLGVRAGDFVYVAGMRGIDPEDNTLVEGAEARVRQGFLNMQQIARAGGAELTDAVRLVVYVTDMYRFRPYVNQIQEELWGEGPYPPRTIVEINRLNQDDFFEVEGTFYAPADGSPGGLAHLSPAGAIEPTATWGLGARAGDFVYVAGMRGIDPEDNSLVEGDEERVRQAFLNMQQIAREGGAELTDATRLVVYVTDMYRYRPIVNQIQEELWGEGPYPPRTIVEVNRLNQDDIVEVEGTFYAPAGDSPEQVKHLSPEGAIEPTATWGLGVRAGDYVYVAGMRGIDPEDNSLVEGDEERVRQGFLNMQQIAREGGAELTDATRLVVYVTDMYRYRPIVNEIQEELWGEGPYPPRTIVEIRRLNQDDIFEVEGTFYRPEAD